MTRPSKDELSTLDWFHGGLPFNQLGAGSGIDTTGLDWFHGGLPYSGTSEEGVPEPPPAPRRAYGASIQSKVPVVGGTFVMESGEPLLTGGGETMLAEDGTLPSNPSTMHNFHTSNTLGGEWTRQADAEVAGNFYLRSVPRTTAMQSDATLQVVVPYITKISFDWGISANNKGVFPYTFADHFQFFVDDVEQFKMYGAADSGSHSLVLTAGTYNLKWRYTAAPVSGNHNRDMAWIDNLLIDPNF